MTRNRTRVLVLTLTVAALLWALLTWQAWQPPSYHGLWW